MNRRLLADFLERYPFQPATALWRAVEVEELARLPFPSGRGLDLGCGDGQLTQLLSQRIGGLRLVGLDIDALETSQATESHFYERVYTSSAEVVPEPDAAFDFVVSVSVMEHIPGIHEALAEVARVLKPGGTLITTVPSIGFHDCLRGPVLRRRARASYCDALDKRLAHLRYWRIDQWDTALDAVGMTLVEARPFLSAAEVRRWESISRLTAGILHTLTGRRAPIEIQRSLGLRKAGLRMPRPLAALLSALLTTHLPDSSPGETEDRAGCVLIVASRR